MAAAAVDAAAVACAGERRYGEKTGMRMLQQPGLRASLTGRPDPVQPSLASPLQLLLRQAAASGAARRRRVCGHQGQLVRALGRQVVRLQMFAYLKL